jgi:two-component sensor histidine kinase/PAS domain-containing protein
LSSARINRVRGVARTLGIAAFAIAGTAFLGYISRNPLLFQLRSDLHGMSPLTATGLASIAIAVLASSWHRARFVQATAVVAAIVSIVTLGCHALVGTDNVSVIIGTAMFGVPTQHVGRTSVATGVSLFFLASAAIFRRKRPFVADVLSGASLVISGVALLGYIYGVADLYALPMFNSMGLNTAVALTILAIAEILVEPEVGWASVMVSHEIGGGATRRQLSFIVVPVIAGWLLVQATNAGQIGASAAMALLVVTTVVPLAMLILRDGRVLTDLNRRRVELQQTEQELAFALKAGRLGSWEIDLVQNTLIASEICREVFGLAPDAPYEYGDLVHRIDPRDMSRRRAAIERAIRKRSDLEIEYRIIRPGKETAWIWLRGKAEYDDAGKPTRLAGISLDVTERKRAEQRQRLLLDELNHRVKNTLATVQSISVQTRRTAESPAAFVAALEGRLAALSGAHDLLTGASWDGVMLCDVIALTLAPYAPLGGAHPRVVAHGPSLRLNPNAAVTISMAFHELATNAAKYGALSCEEGSIKIAWDRSVSDPLFIDLTWREAGGPPVALPDKRGFGSKLLQQGLAREMNGSVTLEFEPEGLHCFMRFALSPKLELIG